MTEVRSDAPIVLAAGGTGGHIFPAQALAEELQTRGHRLVLITDRRGSAYGGALAHVEQHRVRAGSPVARGPFARASGALSLLIGMKDARTLLRRIRPSVAIGFGGYPSVPTMIAAARADIPCAIHEQNAVLGRANRLLAPRVWAIATSFSETTKIAEADRNKVTLTGNPVRPAIAALRAQPYVSVANGATFCLLVTGGSQGARIFARVVPGALAKLAPDLRAHLSVVQQCRAEDLDTTRRTYEAGRIQAELAPFFDDLPARLGAAHLVIGRAGASTISELSVAGRPSIVVPLPQATDDHQTANARALADVGAAVLLPQSEFTPERLAERLDDLVRAPESLERAARAARDAAKPDSAKELADLVERLVPANGGSKSRATDRRHAA